MSIVWRAGISAFVCVLSFSASAPAHDEIIIGQSATGQLTIASDVPLPHDLPPSVFPGFPGWADSSLGFESTTIDEPLEDLFQLHPAANIRLIMLAADPGMRLFLGNDIPVGGTFDFGQPFFDFHPIWSLYPGALGETYSVTIRLIDLSGHHTDSNAITITFRAVESITACPCRGDLNDDHRLDGLDVQAFVGCILNAAPGAPPAAGCACADVNGDAAADAADIAAMVERLLADSACP